MTMTDDQVDERLTTKERYAIIEAIPWVAHASKSFDQRCEVLRSAAPMSVRYPTAESGQRLEEDPIRDKWRCKNKAHWVFIGLDGRIRVLCFVHLFYAGLWRNMAEDDRYNKWAAQWDRTHYRPDLDPNDRPNEEGDDDDDEDAS